MARRISVASIACILALATLSLVACAQGEADNSTGAGTQDDQGFAVTEQGQSRFSVLDGTNKSGMHVKSMVIVDGETGVQYLWIYRSGSYQGGGGLTVLLDSDGKPLLATQADRQDDPR